MFEWDEAKRLRNIEERGVDFRLAVRIFEQPVMEAADTRKPYGESRIRALGQIDQDFYVVAYTWRQERRRIISAWKVTDDGKRRYTAILSDRD